MALNFCRLVPGVGMTLKPDPDRMFIDPVNDSPNKLIYTLLGYLAWTDDTCYKEELLELHEMLKYRLEQIEVDEQYEAKKVAAKAEAG